MKNSKDTNKRFNFQKYGKLLCLETILFILLLSCSRNAKGELEILSNGIFTADSLSNKNSFLQEHKSSKPIILGIDRIDIFWIH